MDYSHKHLPTTSESCEGFRLATFDDETEDDGQAMTFDESDFADYRAEVIKLALAITGFVWITATDEDGVYLTLHPTG